MYILNGGATVASVIELYKFRISYNVTVVDSSHVN